MKQLVKRIVAVSGAAALAALLAVPAPASADVDLWPLFEKTEDSMTVLYPFYVKEKSFRMVLPFYYRTNEGRDHHVLWPLLKVSDGRVVRAAPLYFSGQDQAELTIFPFYRRTPEYTVTLIPPRYTTQDDQVEIVFPLYSWASEGSPETGQVESLDVLWPLYSRAVERDAHGEVVAQSRRFLLFSDVREASGARTFKMLGVPISEQY